MRPETFLKELRGEKSERGPVCTAFLLKEGLARREKDNEGDGVAVQCAEQVAVSKMARARSRASAAGGDANSDEHVGSQAKGTT